MLAIFSRLFVVLIVILALPTTLILASQNANPGDNTYPVKRGMEGVLQSVLSLNPITKAYFKSDLSNRRYKESIALLKKESSDKSVTNTALIEMLNSTALARVEINKVSDPVVKKQLSEDLSKQIAIYRQGLKEAAEAKQQAPKVLVSPIPTIIPIQREPTPTQTQTKNCTNTTRNYSQCGGTIGYENYPRTHLLMLLEQINSCTQVKRVTVKEDWNLNIDCDPTIIGECSVDNLSACADMLAKPAFSSMSGVQPSSVVDSVGTTEVTTTVQTKPTVTLTTTPTPQNIIYRTMQFIFPRNNGSGGLSGGLSADSLRASFENPVLESSESATAKISLRATSSDDESGLTKGEIYIIKSSGQEMSDVDCSGDNGLKVPGNLSWCKISTTALSGSSGNISGLWKIYTPGEYYAVVNIYSGSNICSGNPWCKFNGNSCIADESGNSCISCKGISDCGESSKIKFTIQ